MLNTNLQAEFTANDNADAKNNAAGSIMDFLGAQDIFAPEKAIKILRESIDRGINILP